MAWITLLYLSIDPLAAGTLASELQSPGQQVTELDNPDSLKDVRNDLTLKLRGAQGLESLLC